MDDKIVPSRHIDWGCLRAIQGLSRPVCKSVAAVAGTGSSIGAHRRSRWDMASLWSCIATTESASGRTAGSLTQQAVNETSTNSHPMLKMVVSFSLISVADFIKVAEMDKDGSRPGSVPGAAH